MDSESPSTQAQVASQASMDHEEVGQETPPVVSASKKSQKKAESRKKGVPNDLKLSALPRAEDIRKAVPAEGINIRDLVAKFPSIDESNSRLFAILVEVLCCVQSDMRVLPRPDHEMPSEALINETINEAKSLPMPEPELELAERRKTRSEWTFQPIVTYGQAAERIRQASNTLPPSLFRVLCEHSTTLSSYMNAECHTEYQEVTGLKLQLRLLHGNAFQSLGKPDISDLTKERVERHLSWGTHHPPSSYISTFNCLDSAEERAYWHYHISKGHIGRRVSCAKISTDGFVAATVRGEVLKTGTIIKKLNGRKGVEVETPKTAPRHVQIPIWVRLGANTADPPATTLEDLIESGAEIWLSMTELRVSDWKISVPYTRDYEWLSLGKISETSIRDIWPYDGKNLHMEKPDRPVHSLNSPEPYVFNWETKKWEHNVEEALAQLQRLEKTKNRLTIKDPGAGDKRSRAQVDDSNEDGENDPPAKRKESTQTPEEKSMQDSDSRSLAIEEQSLAEDETTTSTIEESQTNASEVNRCCCPNCGKLH